MAFENINVISLKNEINSCMNSINYNSSKEILNKISGSDIWNTESKKNFERALTKLINIRYLGLENKLKNYLKIADKIEEYQKLSSVNASSQIELTNIMNELNELTNETEIATLNDQVSNLKKEIDNNEIKLTTIKRGMEDLF